MNEAEVAAWQLNDLFTAREIAALVMGISPHEASDQQLEPVLRRMRSDYGTAMQAHSDIINPDGEDGEPYTAVPGNALQSKVMVVLTDQSGREYNPHRVWDWLCCNSSTPDAWSRSDFDKQSFSRVEVSKWLIANRIESKFAFDCSANNHEYRPNNVMGQGYISEKLKLMIGAATKWWGNADRDDRGTHPDNAKVAAWLVQRGYSQTLAEKAATIIRPDWAPPGRKPNE